MLGVSCAKYLAFLWKSLKNPVIFLYKGLIFKEKYITIYFDKKITRICGSIKKKGLSSWQYSKKSVF